MRPTQPEPVECPTCGFNRATLRDTERWQNYVDVPEGALVERLPDGWIVEASTSLCWNFDQPEHLRLRRGEDLADAAELRATLAHVRREYDRMRCMLAAAMKGKI